VGAQVLRRFEQITALEVVKGNVSGGNLPTISLGRAQGGMVEKFHSPNGPGANSSAECYQISGGECYQISGEECYQTIGRGVSYKLSVGECHSMPLFALSS